MENQKVFKTVAIVSASVLALLTGIIVLVPKAMAKSQEKKLADTLADETTKTPTTQSTPTTVSDNPIGSLSDVQEFQNWMDKNHPNWLDNGTNLNKAFGYGNFGKQTAKAWSLYKTQYQAVPSTQPSGDASSWNSGFANGDKLYFKEGLNFATAYSYPSKEARYQKGSMSKTSTANVAVFVRNSNVKGWIIANAIVKPYGTVPTMTASGIKNMPAKPKLMKNIFLQVEPSNPFTKVGV